MLTYLSRLTNERDSLTQSATDLADKAASEERDLTDTERTSLAGWQTRCAEIDAQLTEYNEQAKSQRAYATLKSSLTSLDDGEPTAKIERRSSRLPEPPKSWGELFVSSEAFLDYVTRGAGASGRVTLPFELEMRAAITTGDVDVPAMQWTPPQYNYVSPLLNACGKVTASTNAVSWIQWTPNPAPAAPVVVEGELKPEMSLTATPQSATLQTYAHHKAITRQALEDVPQIRSIVEGRLRQGVTRALEDAVAAALVAATLPAVGGVDLLSAIRGGIAAVQSAGYARPNAIAINPADAADIDVQLLTGTLNGAVVNGSYWGVPIIPSSGVPAGTAYVGDLSVAVTIFNRGTTEVFMSDSHADYFLRNTLALLAETRALVTVPEPAALAECTGVVTP